MNIKFRPNFIVGIVVAAAIGVSASVAAVSAFSGDDPSSDSSTVSPAQIQALASDLDADAASSQKDALADGVVTYEEHEAAIQAFLACGEAAGFIPNPVPGDGERATRPSFLGVGGSDPTDDEAFRQDKAILDDCRMQHLDAVDMAWAASQPEPTRAELEALHTMIRQCVAEGRTGDPPDVAMSALYKNSPEQAIAITADQGDDYALCALEAEAATGLLTPPAVLAE